MDTQVIIVGAGPVGLTLAIDLGRRGVRCILLEQKEAPQFLPKMERCNARTMEIYRRLGIAQKIRDAGFPRDVPMDVFIITSLVEPPLLQIGQRHKVACHFAGELGAHPATPVTTELLGVDDQGSPVPGAAPTNTQLTIPGYEKTWYDLRTKQTTGV